MKKKKKNHDFGFELEGIKEGKERENNSLKLGGWVGGTYQRLRTARRFVFVEPNCPHQTLIS
jgi:hypothetical protein